MEQIGSHRCFGGQQLRFSHRSATLDCEMTFSLYLPPQSGYAPVPVLYWLSGLTCTDENFVIKAGAQRYAARHGIAILAPDTSPRGDAVPDDPEGGWDLGPARASTSTPRASRGAATTACMTTSAASCRRW